MARVLPTELPAGFLEHLQYISIAHLGPPEVEPHVHEATLETKVGHECSHHTTHSGLPSTTHPLLHNRIKKFIASVDAALSIADHNSIAIAIQCNAVVGPRGHHPVDHGLRMRGPHLPIDIESIGLMAHANHIGAKLVKDITGHMVGRTVGGIHDQLQALE